MKSLMKFSLLASLSLLLASCCCDRDNCCAEPYCAPKPSCCAPRVCAPQPCPPPARGCQPVYYDR